MKKIYIASSIHNVEMVRAVDKRLVDAGASITYRWHEHGYITDKTLWPSIAEAEANGVLSADNVLVLLPGGFGTHVEIGIALGSGKKVILYAYNDKAWTDASGKICIFHHYPKFVVCESLEDAIRETLQ